MRRLLCATLLAIVALAPAPAFADCRVGRGQAVALFGGADDPDVLVWDSRARLLQYEAGSADTRRFLLPHAILTRPGIRVKVQSCVSNVVHPKFRFYTEDAVAVQFSSGPYRGKYGWVTSSDVQLISR